MILYEKLKKRYSEKEIRYIFPTMTARDINYNRKKVQVHILAKYIDFKEIGYSSADLAEDYPELKIKYQEFEIIYKIFSRKKNINELKEELGLTDVFDYYLKKGINFNSESPNFYKIIDIFKIPVDYKKFQIDTYSNHIELFGDKEDLINFKEKYGIDHPVLLEPIKNKWHLAFDGFLAEYIKKKIEKIPR